MQISFQWQLWVTYDASLNIYTPKTSILDIKTIHMSGWDRAATEAWLEMIA